MGKVGALLGGALVVVGCAGSMRVFTDLTPPRVKVRAVRLVERPAAGQMEAALCPRALRAEGSLAETAVCELLTGPAPAQSPTAAFDVELEIQNQNYVALPVSAILLGIELRPDETAPWQGVACLSLCPAEDPYCGVRERPEAPCAAARPGVPDERAYFGAHADLVVGRGVLLSTGEHARRERPSVPARSKLRVTARFDLVPGALVEVLSGVARRRSAELWRGQPLPLTLPFEIDGAVFVAAGAGTKRLAQSFGPARGTWALSEPVVLGR